MKWQLFDRIASRFAQVSAKAKSDFVYTGAAQGIGLATSFLTALLITKRLGLDQLGAYALIVSISTFIAALAEVGIGQTATRYASVAKANSEPMKCNEVLAWAINARIAFAIVSLIGGLYFSEWLGAHVWSGSTSSEFIPHAFVLGAVTILQQCANAYFHTHHEFRFMSLTTFMNSALILGSALTLDRLGLLSLESLVFVSIAASLVTFVIVLVKTSWRRIYAIDEHRRWPQLRLRFQISEKTIGPMDATYGIRPQTFAAYLLASALIVTFFTRLDIWMIGALLTETDVGIYKLASYFAIPLALVVGALNTTLWPRASKLVTQETISAFIHKTVRISLLLMLPSTLYILSLNWLPALIFPAHAAPLTGLAIALCARYVLATLITPAAVVGYSMGMSRIYVIVNTLQLLSIFVINSYFMSSIGLYAPALALIVSELISIAIIWPALRKRVRTLATV